MIGSGVIDLEQERILGVIADKGGSKAFERSVAGVRSAIEAEGCPPPAAIVATSARDKFGRDAMWRMLRPVALSPKRPSHSDAD